ncbi:hypothetical protein EV182_005169, partial [Spiromyces aspiralis]
MDVWRQVPLETQRKFERVLSIWYTAKANGPLFPIEILDAIKRDVENESGHKVSDSYVSGSSNGNSKGNGKGIADIATKQWDAGVAPPRGLEQTAPIAVVATPPKKESNPLPPDLDTNRTQLLIRDAGRIIAYLQKQRIRQPSNETLKNTIRNVEK